MHDFKCAAGEKPKTTENLMSSCSEEEKIENNPAGEGLGFKVGIKFFSCHKKQGVATST